jgi:hypothetical protein
VVFACIFHFPKFERIQNVPFINFTSNLKLYLFPDQSFIFFVIESSNCTSGWTKFENSCYKFFENSNNYSNMESANEHCKSKNASLISINSKQENYLAEILAEIGDGSVNAWIGLTYNTTASKFVNLDGTPVTFTAWKVAWNPHERDLTTKCVEIDKSDPDWKRVDCNIKSTGYICERRGK